MSRAYRKFEDDEQQGAPALACSCGRAASWEELSSLGARCTLCYRAYCSAHVPGPTKVANVPEGPIAWAQRLKLREAAGDRLTIVQREAWRSALRHEESAA